GQDVDINQLQAQADAVQAQKSQAVADARKAEADKIAQEKADIDAQIASLDDADTGGFNEEQRAAGITSSADIREQGRQQRAQQQGSLGAMFFGGLGFSSADPTGGNFDAPGGTGGAFGQLFSVLSGDTRSLYGSGSILGADQAVSVNQNTDAEAARRQREVQRQQLEQQRAQLEASEESRVSGAGSAAGAEFAGQEFAAGAAISSGIAQNQANAEARQRNQQGAADAFAINQRRQKQEFIGRQRDRTLSARESTGALREGDFTVVWANCRR
ncbi:MAG: hypothetical protein ACYS5F_12855, partial [Planctomycetota bacterium]